MAIKNSYIWKIRKRNKVSLIYLILGVYAKVCFVYKWVVSNYTAKSGIKYTLKKRMGKQKKFTNDIGDYNGIGGVTEAESLFLPKYVKGRKKLDAGFETIYDYHFLTPIVEQTCKDFFDDIKSNMSKTEILKINSGLSDYVFSPNKKSYNLDLLKCSLVNALETNILKYNYEMADEDIQQIIPKNYFEKLDDFYNIDKSWLIKNKNIIFYKDKAYHYSLKALNEFFSKCDIDIDDSNLYRGLGNSKYDKNSKKENNADIISAYTGITEPVLYFEKNLLNSYSLNRRVAETFMMHQNNTRKGLVEANLQNILENVFSSFLVTDIFEDGQYEFLCLPNSNDLYISEDVNDSISAEFHISNSPVKPIRMIRKNVDEDYEDENEFD